METNELYRGRLIDHLQLVVKDIMASQKFYEAIASSLNIPISGKGEDFIWIDELFISSNKSLMAQGNLIAEFISPFRLRMKKW